MSLKASAMQQLPKTVSRFVQERLRPLQPHAAEPDRIPDAVVAEARKLDLCKLSFGMFCGLVRL